MILHHSNSTFTELSADFLHKFPTQFLEEKQKTRSCHFQQSLRAPSVGSCRRQAALKSHLTAIIELFFSSFPMRDSFLFKSCPLACRQQAVCCCFSRQRLNGSLNERESKMFKLHVEMLSGRHCDVTFGQSPNVIHLWKHCTKYFSRFC